MRRVLPLLALVLVGCIVATPGCAHAPQLISGPDPAPYAAGPVSRYCLGGPRR